MTIRSVSDTPSYFQCPGGRAQRPGMILAFGVSSELELQQQRHHEIHCDFITTYWKCEMLDKSFFVASMSLHRVKNGL